ncbi:major facilitator superfamily protein [Stylonychia lemnae]|uniref:Major facilitator superfamily protein n=1 Tax=Stylonychia lemnae TaxID=5949 RepID=A0A077ZRE4_STYLE|nr:major facilitator superfamily protein [Stylonychia lemnae]|eukprot:CDW71910.1 major facilitator superfamily protein [Stylonychia lemnae]
MRNLGYQGLGFYSVATIYLFLGLGSFISSGIVEKFGSRSALTIGGLQYAFWVICYLFPTFADKSENKEEHFVFSKGFILFLSLLSSIMIGLGASIIWVGQGRYVTECSTPENKGLYSSIFWCYFNSSILVCNIFSAVILDYCDITTFYILLSIISLCGCASFLLLSEPEKPIQPLRSFKGDVLGVLSLIRDKRMIQYIPLCSSQAITLVGSSGVLFPLVYKTLENQDISANAKFQLCMYSSLPLGFGEVIGSLIAGQIIDKFGLRQALLGFIFTIVLSYSTFFYFIFLWEYGWVNFALSFIWGVQESFVINLNQLICGFEFKSNIIPFSIQKLVQSIMTFTLLLIASLLNTQFEVTIYLIITGCFKLMAAFLMLRFKFISKSRKQSNKENLELQKSDNSQKVEKNIENEIESEMALLDKNQK